MIQIIVQLPDDPSQQPDPGRVALEALAIEGYKAGTLSHYQAARVLWLSRFEFDGFLKERHIYDHAYDLLPVPHRVGRMLKAHRLKAVGLNPVDGTKRQGRPPASRGFGQAP